MRFILVLLFSGLFFTVLDSKAEARRGSTTQELIFIVETNLKDGENALSVCKLVETWTVFFVNFYRSIEGYGLATNECDSENYFGLSNAQITQFKSEGAIPADIPDEPVLTISEMVEGHWGLLLLAVGLVLVLYNWFQKRSRAEERQKLMGDIPLAARSVLELMCYVAKADGTIDECEVETIVKVTSEITGHSIDMATARQISVLADKEATETDVKRMVKGIEPGNYKLTMSAILQIAAADRHLDEGEEKFVGMVAKEMGMSGEEVSLVLEQLYGDQS